MTRPLVLVRQVGTVRLQGKQPRHPRGEGCQGVGQTAAPSPVEQEQDPQYGQRHAAPRGDADERGGDQLRARPRAYKMRCKVSEGGTHHRCSDEPRSDENKAQPGTTR